MNHLERVAIYHAGERYVQDRAGQAEAAAAVTGAIHRELPEPAVAFLVEREWLAVAAADAAGDVWVSSLVAQPGFARAIDARTLRIEARLPAHDPLAETLAGTASVGTIAIDFATRRRMRFNGNAIGDARGTTIAAEQVYANCPKFIAARSVVAVDRTTAPQVRIDGALGDAARALVAAADTFSIGTANGSDGADASHRGGNAGFVEIVDDRTLRWPDYRGNAMYMTLGNIAASPRAGLLFVDWATGDTLQLTGSATIDWDPARAADVPGAQRFVTFAIERAVFVRGGSPLRWSDAVASRVNPPLERRGPSAPAKPSRAHVD